MENAEPFIIVPTTRNHRHVIMHDKEIAKAFKQLTGRACPTEADIPSLRAFRVKLMPVEELIKLAKAS